jgi:hypothetical protein
VLLNGPLAFKVGDASVPLGPADRGVDEVPDAGRAGRIRQRLTLPFFNVDAQVWRLHAVTAVYPAQCPVERLSVIQITLNHLGSGLA